MLHQKVVVVFLHLTWNRVQNGLYRERRGGSYGIRVPSKKQKTKMATYPGMCLQSKSVTSTVIEQMFESQRIDICSSAIVMICFISVLAAACMHIVKHSQSDRHTHMLMHTLIATDK